MMKSKTKLKKPPPYFVPNLVLINQYGSKNYLKLLSKVQSKPKWIPLHLKVLIKVQWTL